MLASNPRAAVNFSRALQSNPQHHFDALRNQDFVMKLRNVLLLLSVAVLSACAAQGPRERDEQMLERYLEFAGPPVESFSYLGRVNGWNALGDDQLVIFTSVNDAYLLSLASPCRDLQFAKNIRINATGSTVHSRFDTVRVDQTCQITQIRPVDYGAVREAAREERKARG
jgi:hypothetical protein